MTTRDEEERAERLRNRLISKIHSSDEALVDELLKLGFTSSSVSVLGFVPLVMVAWANGDVTEDEAERLREFAEVQGMHKKGREVLENLLAFRPEPAFVERCLRLLNTIYANLPTDEGARARVSLVQLALAIGETSGRFLGLFGEGLSVEERMVIERYAEVLEVPMSDKAREIHRSVIVGSWTPDA